MPAKKKAAKKGTSKSAAAYNIQRFFDELIRNGGNQTQAAIAIGVPKRGAATWASAKLKQPDISARWEKRKQEALIASHLDTHDVLLSLARGVQYDPRKLFHPDGSQKSIHELDDDTALALQGFEVHKTETESGSESNRKVTVKHQFKVRAGSRDAARDQAIKILGLYKEQPPPPPAANPDMDLTDAMRRVVYVLEAGMLATKGKKK